jgi:hypothetical protein
MTTRSTKNRGLLKDAYFILPMLALFVWACTMTTEPTEETVLFQIKVDSISHPRAIMLGDTAAIRFYGTVGPDGCHSFSRFLVIRQPRAVDFVVWGKRTIATACPAVMVYLDGRTYRYLPSQRGMLVITVHQPDGSTLKDSLLVK